MMSSEEKWNAIYDKKLFSLATNVLIENSFLLPKKGKALDLACGLGENALFLADKKLETHAWDISSTALNRLRNKALQSNLEVTVKQTNIEASIFKKNYFDVIVISRFLDRSLSNAIIDTLKADGLLFYQTYVKEKTSSEGPNNPAYLLDRNELLTMFHQLALVSYKEHGLMGDIAYGERSEACFIGQKIF